MVQTSTLGADITVLNKTVKDLVMLRYHLISMGIKLSKPTTIFMDKTSVVLNENNPKIALIKKTVALSYHFVREHVAKNFVDVRKIHIGDNFVDPFTEPLVINDFHGFYHE